MSDVIITVRGEHELRVAPERAKVHLSVTMDGPDRAAVVERTLAASTPIRAGLEKREAEGSIVEWTSQRMNVIAERPWNNEGKQLDPVHRATVDFTATFSDISEMSLWATEVSVADGVNLGYIDWHLTAETEAEIEREVATQAVGVAVARAKAYAQALGLQHVRPLELADRGLISENAGPVQAKALRAGAMMMDAASSPAMEFQGEEIRVSATVEGRFAAS